MGFVYFIAISGSQEPWVKIGYTSGDVYNRCARLQTGCPLSLNVLAYAPGSMDDEKYLHNRFRAFRGYGEWFVLDGFLRHYVNSLTESSAPKMPAPTLWTKVWHEEHVI